MNREGNKKKKEIGNKNRKMKIKGKENKNFCMYLNQINEWKR
jgi:hypothetical protein